MSTHALRDAGHKLEVATTPGSTWGGFGDQKHFYALKVDAVRLVTAADNSAASKALLTTLLTEVYEPAFRDYWQSWIMSDWKIRWLISSTDNKSFHEAVLNYDAEDRVKMFALLCHRHMNNADAAIEVAREHVKTHAADSPKTKTELLMYLNPALAQYGEEYFYLLKSLVVNASTLDGLKSKEARDFQLSLFNMTYGYDPKIHKDILVKDWEIIELDEAALKESSKFSYRYTGIPFRVKAFREYTLDLRVADLIETPNVIPRNTAGRAAIKIMDDYIAGGASTPAERLNLTVSAFQALVARYSTDSVQVSRSIYSDLFAEIFMPMCDAENLMRLTKIYFESEESATAQYKTWNSVLNILLGTNKNKWAKTVSNADSIASLMLKEMGEMEVIHVLRSLVGEDPAIPPMTTTQWIKYLELYKEYKDSPPSIIVSLIR